MTNKITMENIGYSTKWLNDVDYTPPISEEETFRQFASMGITPDFFRDKATGKRYAKFLETYTVP